MRARVIGKSLAVASLLVGGAGCGSLFDEGEEEEVAVCGVNTYPDDAGDCICEDGYGWCTSNPDDMTCCPEEFNVAVHEALIAPAKNDDCQWDGLTCDPLSPEDLDQFGAMIADVASAAAGLPRTEAAERAVSFVMGAAFDHYSKPDIVGGMCVDQGDGCEADIAFSPLPDNFRPSLSGQYVGLSADLATVMVILEDEDADSNDPAGSFIFDVDDMIEIYTSGGTGWMPNPDQESSIALLKITVTETR